MPARDLGRYPDWPAAMSADAAAAYLDMSASQFRRLVQEHRMPQPIRLSPGSPRWRKADLDAAIGGGKIFDPLKADEERAFQRIKSRA